MNTLTRLGAAARWAVILAAAFGLVAGAHAQPKLPDSAKDHTYVGNSQCKICHNNPKEGGQWDKWKAEKHAHALDLLKTDEAKAAAAKAGVTGPPDQAPQCLKCHVTGYDEAKAAVPDKIKPEEGIQCESCHGPASEHLKDAKIVKMSPDKLGEVELLAHLVRPTEETCKGCHNDTSPTWKNDRFTLPSGEKVGFDFTQAWAIIAHDHPDGVMEAKYGGKYPVDKVGDGK